MVAHTVVPKLRKLRQKDYCEVEASLGYREHKTLNHSQQATCRTPQDQNHLASV